ncbi:Fe2OG dioxygenase domain-containing protein [Aphelenchoides besseyi]|nr:Fe2OG dioxygenase domain-containing protein [Aphelenchoides besseyi]
MAKKSKAFGAKKKPSTAKPNPFDLKYTKQKRDVVGTARYTNGNPLGTRKKAHEIRKNTIGKELKLLGKQNQIKDRRLGQNNPTLSSDEKSMMRFIAQRKNLTSKKTEKFLLSDEQEDTLDHLLDHLTEAEKFQRGVGHEQNEEEDLDPELLAQTSFGGGSLESTKTDEHGRKLTRKEMLDQIISNSKQQKALRQRDRKLQLEQWQKLDEQFTELRGAGELKFGRSEEKTNEEDDDYMALYQQLEFDKKAPALDPRKDPLKQTEYEQKRVEKSEAERQKRMTEGEVTFAEHPSVDEDVGVNRRKRAITQSEEFQLRYDAQGNPILKDAPLKGILKNSKPVVGQSADEEPEFWTQDDLDFEEEKLDGDEFVDFEDTAEEESDLEDDEEIDEDGAESDEQLASDLEDLEEQSDEQAAEPTVIPRKKSRIEEIIQSEEPNSDGPVAKFWYEITANNYVELDRLNELAQGIYQRAKFNSTKFAVQFLFLFDRIFNEVKTNRRTAPNFKFFAFLRVTYAVFSVSDRIHAICLPATALVMDCISRARIHNALDCAKVLLICNEMALWVEESKRYCPEVLAFLHGVLMMATENSTGQSFNGIGFPVSKPHRHMLYLNDKVSYQSESTIERFLSHNYKLLLSYHCVPFTLLRISLNQHRLLDLQVIRLAVSLTRYFAQLYDNIPDTYSTIFRMIEMLEPKIEEHFNARHPTHRRDDPQAQEKRLTKRLRRETRSAVKELRQDARYIAGHQQKVRKDIDDERIRKTNNILASLQTQESDYQKRKNHAKMNKDVGTNSKATEYKDERTANRTIKPTLDANDFIAPDTIRYIPNFITIEEEQRLLARVYAVPKPKWDTLRNRRLQSWGGLWLQTIIDKIMTVKSAFSSDHRPNHVLINEYLPQQGIMPHTDGPAFHPLISTLSLGSSTCLDFYEPLQGGQKRSLEQRQIGSILLQPRSLVLIKDHAYELLHGIRELRADIINEKVFNRPKSLPLDTKTMGDQQYEPLLPGAQPVPVQNQAANVANPRNAPDPIAANQVAAAINQNQDAGAPAANNAPLQSVLAADGTGANQEKFGGIQSGYQQDVNNTGGQGEDEEDQDELGAVEEDPEDYAQLKKQAICMSVSMVFFGINFSISLAGITVFVITKTSA